MCLGTFPRRVRPLGIYDIFVLVCTLRFASVGAKPMSTGPSHSDIEKRGEPFGAKDKAGRDQDANEGDAPYNGKQDQPRFFVQH